MKLQRGLYANNSMPLKPEELTELFGMKYKFILKALMDLDKTFENDMLELTMVLPDEMLFAAAFKAHRSRFVDRKELNLNFEEELDEDKTENPGIYLEFKFMDREYHLYIRDITTKPILTKKELLATFKVTDMYENTYSYKFVVMQQNRQKLVCIKKIVKAKTKDKLLEPHSIACDIDIKEILELSKPTTAGV